MQSGCCSETVNGNKDKVLQYKYIFQLLIRSCQTENFEYALCVCVFLLCCCVCVCVVFRCMCVGFFFVCGWFVYAFLLCRQTYGALIILCGNMES